MGRVLLLASVGFFLFLPLGRPQGPSATASPDSALVLGLKLDLVPEVLYSQVPVLRPGQGLLVVSVGPQSTAARAGLLRHDILVAFSGVALHSPEQFLRLLGSRKPLPKAPLAVVRGGKEITLTVGPALASSGDPGPTALFKPGGPPALSLEAQSLEGNQISVTFTYYSKGSGKLERVNCAGSLEEIKKKVQELGRLNRMSQRVQDLAEVALERLQMLNSPPKK